MRMKVWTGKPAGTTEAPPSKSMAHRLLICAALAEGRSVIHHVDASEDILATSDCLQALGAKLEWNGSTVTVTGCDPRSSMPGEMRCRESGSTLRFMIPIVWLSGREAVFRGSEKLMSRPLSVYEAIAGDQELLFRQEPDGLRIGGALLPGTFEIPGNISSQFISGLMFALPLMEEDSRIRILPPVESRSYLDLTLQALNDFSVRTKWEEADTLLIPGGSRYLPMETAVEGDYSNAAYLEILNDAGGAVRLTGLRAESLQGDRVYSQYLAEIRRGRAELDVTDCPDLAPALMAAGAMHYGVRLTGTRRLRLKESDRGAAMTEELAKFGIAAANGENEIIVPGGELHEPAEALSGHNDHRIVMALAALCVKTGGIIDGAEAVRKSFPDYWDRLAKMGIKAESETA